jgi:predicted flap endonuclease-1-like 5' DNA nuclease
MIAAYARGEDPLAAPDTGESAPDDLKRIEGIGPKVAARLQAAGITTFARLAETAVEELDAILDAAGYWPADPATWPEQAALAAAGKWEQLAALQKELMGGRRT